MVAADIDPAVLRDSILEGAGPPLECYNFGIGGLTLPSAEKIVEVLSDLFSPPIIVLGIGPLDMEGQHVRIPWQRSADRIEASPWIRYRLGQFSLQGWLSDHLWS